MDNAHNIEGQIAGLIKESILKVSTLAQPSDLAKSIKAGEKITIKLTHAVKSVEPNLGDFNYAA